MVTATEGGEGPGRARRRSRNKRKKIITERWVGDYRAYLRTPHWQDVRRRYWASKMPKRCAVCGRTDTPLDLHHRTYKRIGNERLSDLILLCRQCHEETHAVAAVRKRRKARNVLLDAHRAVARKKGRNADNTKGRRKDGTNPRAVGDNPRARAENPRAIKKGQGSR